MVEKVLELVNELQEITKKKWLSIYVDVDKAEVHILITKTFLSIFEDFTVRKFPSDQHPYEAFAEIKGIKFITLMTQKEYEEYVEKTA
ncbi:hypothetical protein [Ureibacillus thermosphaericus]|uniref:Uncharacterized protein n=1 Tax=Ureibacillus thermosphaericus TaxID=51173 RepID=A0A840PV67_URETH|nr:hypothetical protein [Ureibacillus thermosphaericus]MBB5148622.1 hypothetical protein [Ureibacillus thermosphaericus]NKZ31338.1 hypothetical protein [Ureibacillus thermosphaericus]